uniref:Diacylglycerol O-acyltransferase 1 isoform X2 n=1 Tax=Rhizophora mucronata TaxID=61149 RepID=A0A2P2M8M6_RHIMU
MDGLYTNFTSCSPRFPVFSSSPPACSFPLTLKLSDSTVATRSISASSIVSSDNELSDSESAMSLAELADPVVLRRSEQPGSNDAVVSTAIGGTEPANASSEKQRLVTVLVAVTEVFPFFCF